MSIERIDNDLPVLCGTGNLYASVDQIFWRCRNAPVRIVADAGCAG
jgi:hypothetical protein